MTNNNEEILALIQASGVSADSKAFNTSMDDLYGQKLLPDFLEFVDFDLVDFDKREHKDTLEVLLNKNISNFNYYENVVAFKGDIYFLEYEPIPITGLPQGVDARQYFLETKPLFKYQYKKISKEGFLKLVNGYINLERLKSWKKIKGVQIANLKFAIGILCGVLAYEHRNSVFIIVICVLSFIFFLRYGNE